VLRTIAFPFITIGDYQRRRKTVSDTVRVPGLTVAKDICSPPSED
jgi:hypothetical protein